MNGDMSQPFRPVVPKRVPFARGHDDDIARLRDKLLIANCVHPAPLMQDEELNVRMAVRNGTASWRVVTKDQRDNSHSEGLTFEQPRAAAWSVLDGRDGARPDH